MMALSDPPFMRALSSDSHITEPPHTYSARIDPKFRDRAPFVERQKDGGDSFILPGMAGKVPLGIVAAAGIPADKVKLAGVPFEELHKGGWDGKARIADQDRDGVAGEVIYPSVGMMLCNHPDAEYKQACMMAYNGWLAEEFCAAAPDRLFGLGQTAVVSVEQTIKDFEKFKEWGFKGVMMPGTPATEIPYHHPDFDPLWRASVELNLPISFHILTSRSDGNNPLDDLAKDSGAGSDSVKTFMYGNQLIKALQNLAGQFIFGHVFERVPELKVVLVEGDAGWAPHYIERLNHAYDRHRFTLGVDGMKKLPGDLFKENIYLTFQDDPVAWKTADLMNPDRLLWANDFPHPDASWPWSQDIFRRNAQGLSEELVRKIVYKNTAELYDIPIPAEPVKAAAAAA
jgi:predicted TIM-barrel fold metal-dependent hydrolase